MIRERSGQLQVRDNKTGKLLGKVYVKVFRKNAQGTVSFHKDGYTDLRGRFDYVSLSGGEGRDAVAFSILILSSDRGAAVKEVRAPQR